MPELRLTLLVVGLIFLAGLAWWELRRPHQVRGSDLPRPGPEPADRGMERSNEWSTAERPADWDAERLELPRISTRDPDEELPVVEVQPEQFAALEAHAESSPAPSAAAPPAHVEPQEFGKVDNLLAELGIDDSDPPIFDMTGVFRTSVAARRTDPPLTAPRARSAPPGNVPPASESEPELDFGAAPAPEAAAPAPQVHASPFEVHDTQFVETAQAAPQEPESGELSGESVASLLTESARTAEAVAPTPHDAAIPPPQPPAAAQPLPVPVAAEAPAPAVIVQWPAAEDSKVIAVRLVNTTERFSGRAIRMALAAEGFVLGGFDIFHKPAANGHALLSVASLTKPGTFAADSMDVQRYSGLNLFTVLPGPLPGPAAVDELLNCAYMLSQRLRGALQDDQGEPLSPARTALMRAAAGAAPTAPPA